MGPSLLIIASLLVFAFELGRFVQRWQFRRWGARVRKHAEHAWENWTDEDIRNELKSWRRFNEKE